MVFSRNPHSHSHYRSRCDSSSSSGLEPLGHGLLRHFIPVAEEFNETVGDRVMSKELRSHIPVLRDEIVHYLGAKRGGDYIDCTFGRGGYARAILEAHDQSRVFALDRDPSATDAAHDLLKSYPGRLQYHEACFDELKSLFKHYPPFDGIVWDLGVSSPQLDKPERGFSFREDGPLDMRMGSQGITAAEIVNTFPRDDLANLIYQLGEERRSRVVASIICERREEKPIETTIELANLVRKVVPKAKDGIDPATRTFQALRLAVNDELGQIRRSLEQAISLLKVGGRLVIVSFHSLEDRIVKHFIAQHTLKKAVNKYRIQDEDLSLFRVLTKKPVEANEAEKKRNPRSRSAKLRAVELVRLP